MAVSLSPLAPKGFPSLPPLAGVRLATAACEVKYRGRSDVCLIALDPGSTAAGVFTTSKTASAPVEWCRAKLAEMSRRKTEPSDDTIEKRYAKYGAYKGLALWMDLTADWHGER